MNKTFEGKVVVVTGGASGIGLATAKRFSELGAAVYVTGRREAELAAAVKAIGGDVTGVQGDASKLADLDTLYDTVQRRHAHIDVLVPNAGGGSMLPLGAITEEHYEDTFGRNVKGVIFTVQKALPLLRDGGAIVLIGSTAGSDGTPAFSVYGASKAAVVGLTKSVAADYVAKGIRCNAIAPGTVDTPSLGDRINSYADPVEARKNFIARQPMGRLAQAHEIAPIIVYLASDESVFATGQIFSVDGGMTI